MIHHETKHDCKQRYILYLRKYVCGSSRMQLGNEAEPHGEFVSAVVVSHMDSRGDTVWKSKENNFSLILWMP